MYKFWYLQTYYSISKEPNNKIIGYIFIYFYHYTLITIIPIAFNCLWLHSHLPLPKEFLFYLFHISEIAWHTCMCAAYFTFYHVIQFYYLPVESIFLFFFVCKQTSIVHTNTHTCIRHHFFFINLLVNN